MKTIELTQGYVALVDDEDYERVSQFKWHASEYLPYAVYATRTTREADGKRSNHFLHRFVLNVIESKIKVDHKDHNGLNNQKSNIRIATPLQNMGNRRKLQIGTSKFKGVFWETRSNKWRAQLIMECSSKGLGYFTSEEEAALAYDVAAREYFGEFALTNFNVAGKWNGPRAGS